MKILREDLFKISSDEWIEVLFILDEWYNIIIIVVSQLIPIGNSVLELAIPNHP